MNERAWAVAVVFGVVASGCAAAVDRGDENVDSASFAVMSSDARTATASAWDGSSATLTVALADGTTTLLRYGDDTENVYIGNPEIFPPGPCRAIAKNWNKDLDGDRSDGTFQRHLKGLAQHGCGVSYDAADTANADGSFDLIAVQPTP